jgi:putative endonuclease
LWGGGDAFVRHCEPQAKQSMNRTSNFQPTVYIMANHKSGTIYVGVTSDLPQRAWQHHEGVVQGFTSR